MQRAMSTLSIRPLKSSDHAGPVLVVAKKSFCPSCEIYRLLTVQASLYLIVFVPY